MDKTDVNELLKTYFSIIIRTFLLKVDYQKMIHLRY